jgi:hypothetical protein
MRTPRVRLEVRQMIVALALALWPAFEAYLRAAEDERLPTAESVAQALLKKFPAARTPKTHEPGQSLMRFAFEPGTPVVELDVPTLGRHLVRTRFFVTSLRHEIPLSEYPVVEAAVAATLIDGRLVLEVCLSPMFTVPTRDFIARLVGTRVGRPEDRERFGREVGMLFARITPEGRLGEGRLEGDRFHIDVWNGERRWREVRIRFDPDGRVRSVVTVNPVSGLDDDLNDAL